MTSSGPRPASLGKGIHGTAKDLDPLVDRHIRILHDGGGPGEAASEGAAPRPDPSIPPITWLLTEGSRHTTTRLLIRDLSALLVDRGLPLLRVTCFVRTLHPQASGTMVVWLRDRPDPRALRVLRGMEDTPAFQASPLPLIFQGAAAIRRRLDMPGETFDFPVLADLKELGATDYVAMPLAFSDGMINFMTWATDRPGGFSTEELTVLWELLPALALRIEVIERRELTRQLLEVYLGRQTGRRVLAGEIVRGQADSIRAAIWYSDIKDFTALSDRLPRQELIELLDAYFEASVQAVDERGGEILKFLGDGLLAIFPAAESNDAAACAAALAAARDTVKLVRALNGRRLAQDKPTVDFGIALHLGEVGYGNIGGPERLDFTVIGPAVNLASRIEALTRKLGVRVLASADFAASVRDAVRETLTPMGRHAVKGLVRPVEVFAPSDLL